MTEIQLDLFYMSFSKDTPPGAAVAKFKERYGVDPQTVEVSKGLLFVGPIPSAPPTPKGRTHYDQ
jgi:hypothetical protein